MILLHPVSGEEVEVNPANKEDEETLKANGWKPKAEAKAPKAVKAEAKAE